MSDVDTQLWELGFRPADKGFFRYVNGSFDIVVRCSSVVCVEKSNGGLAIGLESGHAVLVSNFGSDTFKHVRNLAFGVTELRLCGHGKSLDAECPECLDAVRKDIEEHVKIGGRRPDVYEQERLFRTLRTTYDD